MIQIRTKLNSLTNTYGWVLVIDEVYGDITSEYLLTWRYSRSTDFKSLKKLKQFWKENRIALINNLNLHFKH